MATRSAKVVQGFSGFSSKVVHWGLGFSSKVVNGGWSAVVVHWGWGHMWWCTGVGGIRGTYMPAHDKLPWKSDHNPNPPPPSSPLPTLFILSFICLAASSCCACMMSCCRRASSRAACCTAASSDLWRASSLCTSASNPLTVMSLISCAQVTPRVTCFNQWVRVLPGLAAA